ncbi:MAG: 50S ribosomal protein L3 N(5)-glutamine methyltransferase [Xanthomonadales bacterium]|nr:50S ribosomal protein L3 N(5)-glutamine methyltransferase [Xanthomonadales bacterium]
MTETQMTVAEWIDRISAQLDQAGLHFGHGTDNARDEAAWLVLHTIGAPLDGRFTDWGKRVSETQAADIHRLAEERCRSGGPLAYLTGRAWFAGLEFEVTPDVLVPRSPLAELILDEFRPWVEPGRLRRVLDLCTGSGCIAIATAVHMPQVQVDATDISPAALRVAANNVARHGLADRVRLLQSDLFQSIPPCRYDLIVANPPYVACGTLAALPREYRSEPSLGLVSGADGLDAVLQILAQAPHYLAPDGILVCEVGESESRLVSVLPEAPFLWLEFERGGSGVFVLTRAELDAAQPAVTALIREREDVA